MNSSATASPCEARPDCHGGAVVRVLARPHALDVLHVLTEEASGPLRFVEVKARLQLSSRVLSDRLSELEDAGLISRAHLGGIPPRVEYAPTRSGLEMQARFRDLGAWAGARASEPAAGRGVPRAPGASV